MPYTTFTWSAIRERLKERYEGVPFWTDEEALLAFNEALYFWNLCTGRWKRRETIATIANQFVYTLSASMVYGIRITFNSYPMTSSSRDDLNNARYTWRSETTVSGDGVPTRPTAWAPISLRNFYIWPADAAGGNTLTADGVAATPVLGQDGDLLDLGEEHLNILLGYSLHVLTFSKSGPFFAVTDPLFKAFLAAAAEENGQIKGSMLYRRVMGLDIRFKQFRGTPTLLDQGAAS